LRVEFQSPEPRDSFRTMHPQGSKGMSAWRVELLLRGKENAAMYSLSFERESLMSKSVWKNYVE
jgi:hypothetical protein